VSLGRSHPSDGQLFPNLVKEGLPTIRPEPVRAANMGQSMGCRSARGLLSPEASTETLGRATKGVAMADTSNASRTHREEPQLLRLSWDAHKTSDHSTEMRSPVTVPATSMMNLPEGS